MQHHLAFNRTRSNYHCHDASNKVLPSSSCDHHYCSRVSSPSSQTFVSSSLVHHNGRRHYQSGPTSSNSSLLDEEQQSSRKISHGDEIDCTTKLTCTVLNTDGFRRRKSASLNSPANSGRRSLVQSESHSDRRSPFVFNRVSSDCWWTWEAGIALALAELFGKCIRWSPLHALDCYRSVE